MASLSYLVYLLVWAIIPAFLAYKMYSRETQGFRTLAAVICFLFSWLALVIFYIAKRPK